MRCRTSGFQDGGAQYLARPQLCKDLVGFYKRECRRLGSDTTLGDDFEEIQPILTRQIGDRYQLPLLPEQVVGKARDIAHVNSRTYHPGALAYRAQRGRHQRAGGA